MKSPVIVIYSREGDPLPGVSHNINSERGFGERPQSRSQEPEDTAQRESVEAPYSQK